MSRCSRALRTHEIAVAGQTEHPFSDRIALDLGRTAADRARPRVEERLGNVHGLIPVPHVRLAHRLGPADHVVLDQRAVEPGEIDAQIHDLLRELADHELEDRASGPPTPAVGAAPTAGRSTGSPRP